MAETTVNKPAAQRKVQIRFVEGFKGSTFDFQNGEVRYLFERAKQPFEVTLPEWRMLRRTGHFEPVPATVTPPVDEQGDSGASSSDDARGDQLDEGQDTREDESEELNHG